MDTEHVTNTETDLTSTEPSGNNLPARLQDLEVVAKDLHSTLSGISLSTFFHHEDGIIVGRNANNDKVIGLNRFSPQLSSPGMLVLGKREPSNARHRFLLTEMASMSGRDIPMLIITSSQDYDAVPESIGGDKFTFSPTGDLQINPLDFSIGETIHANN